MFQLLRVTDLWMIYFRMVCHEMAADEIDAASVDASKMAVIEMVVSRRAAGKIVNDGVAADEIAMCPLGASRMCSLIKKR